MSFLYHRGAVAIVATAVLSLGVGIVLAQGHRKSEECDEEGQKITKWVIQCSRTDYWIHCDDMDVFTKMYGSYRKSGALSRNIQLTKDGPICWENGEVMHCTPEFLAFIERRAPELQGKN